MRFLYENFTKTELIFIRHGETDHNAHKRFQGHFDTVLSEQDKIQAANWQ